MRIDTNVGISPVPGDVRAAPSTAIQGGDAASGASGVELPAAGRTAPESSAASATTSSRLQTLRAMLDQGDYRVDLDRLASRIVDDDILRTGRP